MLSITLDCWSDISGNGFVTVTLHGVTKMMKVFHFTLGVYNLPDARKDEETLTPIVMDCLRTYDIHVVDHEDVDWEEADGVGDVFSGCTDSGGADKTVVDRLCRYPIRCCEHGFQTASRRATDHDDVNAVLKMVNHLVSGIRNSNMMKARFHRIQVENGLVVKELRWYSKTRFNGQTMVADRYMIRKVICHALHVYKLYIYVWRLIDFFFSCLLIT
jgi:hypothetical protein